MSLECDGLSLEGMHTNWELLQIRGEALVPCPNHEYTHRDYDAHRPVSWKKTAADVEAGEKNWQSMIRQLRGE